METLSNLLHFIICQEHLDKIAAVKDVLSVTLSSGYMCSPVVLDKDGVSAAVITAEMSAFLETKKLTLSQQLKNIYNE